MGLQKDWTICKDADEKPSNIKDLKWLSKLRECWLIEMLHLKFHCYLHLYYMLNLWKLMFASFSFDVQPSMEQDLIFSDFVLKINLIKEKTTFSENCPSHPNFYIHYFDTLRWYGDSIHRISVTNERANSVGMPARLSQFPKRERSYTSMLPYP